VGKRVTSVRPCYPIAKLVKKDWQSRVQPKKERRRLLSVKLQLPSRRLNSKVNFIHREIAKKKKKMACTGCTAFQQAFFFDELGGETRKLNWLPAGQRQQVASVMSKTRVISVP
jgi:hypothetical protein